MCSTKTILQLKNLKQEGLSGEEDVKQEGYLHHSAGWYSRVTYYWLTPLLRLGFSRPLELQDLGLLPDKETAATQFQLFNNVYEKHKVIN